MGRDKVRIRFRKADELRFLSHHDLLRVFERMLRRADLPFRSTEGFHPKPKLTFASALGLGIAGLDELVDLELDDTLPLAELIDRLKAQVPPGMTILGVERIDLRDTAHVRQAEFRLALQPNDYPELPERIAQLLTQQELWVERLKPQPRRVNVRPFIDSITLAPDALHLRIHVTPNGSARPEEVLHLLGLGDLLHQGAVLERTRLVLDEQPPSVVAVAADRTSAPPPTQPALSNP